MSITASTSQQKLHPAAEEAQYLFGYDNSAILNRRNDTDNCLVFQSLEKQRGYWLVGVNKDDSQLVIEDRWD
jgi:hypothetical protein